MQLTYEVLVLALALAWVLDQDQVHQVRVQAQAQAQVPPALAPLVQGVEVADGQICPAPAAGRESTAATLEGPRRERGGEELRL